MLCAAVDDLRRHGRIVFGHAVATLDGVAQLAPNFARRPGEIERTQWYQLLDVAPDHRSRAPARSVSPVIR